MLASLKKDLETLKNKSRFISEVIDEKIKIKKVNKDKILV
jgi:hypothetical protein